MAIEWRKHSKPSVLGIATGAVAGLAAVTPAAGVVGPVGGLAIGITSGFVCYQASTALKHRMGYDDSPTSSASTGSADSGTVLAGLFGASASVATR
jgi:Amt family ammonium transporter